MRNPAEDGVVTSQAEPPAPKRWSTARRNRNKKSQGLTPGSESSRGVAPEGWKHLCQEEKSCFPPAAASCAAGARGAKIQASCPVPRLLGGAGRARASSFLTTSPECELGAWGTWGQGSPAPSSALLDVAALHHTPKSGSRLAAGSRAGALLRLPAGRGEASRQRAIQSTPVAAGSCSQHQALRGKRLKQADAEHLGSTLLKGMERKWSKWCAPGAARGQKEWVRKGWCPAASASPVSCRRVSTQEKKPSTRVSGLKVRLQKVFQEIFSLVR